MEFGILQKLVGVMNLVTILSRPFNIQGREPYVISLKKKKKKQQTNGKNLLH